MTRSLTGSPQPRSRSYQPDWVSGALAGRGLPRLGHPGRARVGARHREPVHDQPQRPGGGDPRVLLPQRPGGRVARVGEQRLARLGELLVQLVERGDREEHLAADLELLRDVRAGQAQRHRLDASGCSG